MDLQIEYININEIKPYKGNAKEHPKEQIEQIKKSIQEFGFADPLGIWNGEIVEGHGRYLAAKELKMEQVPVIRLDELTDEQRRAYGLVHNQLTLNSGFNLDTLKIEIGDIQEIDLSNMGFDLNLNDVGGKEETEEELQDKNDAVRILNLEIANFEGVGEYGIPEILPEEYEPCEFIPFSDANTFRGGENATGVHFFIDDYRFNRVWNNPTEQVKVLSRFKCVLTPDFSLFINTPKAVQIFNHYRKHWCGAFWQLMGLKVIPTLCWSDKASFEWCFDGEPKGGAVAVSSVGVMASKETKELFMAGYNEMKKRLEPAQIIHYGKPIEEIKGEVVEIEAFQSRFDRRRGVNENGR